MSNTTDTELVKAVLAAAKSAFGDVGIIDWKTLHSSPRSTVARIAMITDQGARTAIVKAGTTGGRERAALGLLTQMGTPGVPALLGTGDDPPLMLLEDLGETGSLADRLLAPDRPAAETAVVGWAEAVARLHVATLAAGPAFRDRLALLPEADGRDTDRTPGRVDEAAGTLPELLDRLGVAAPAEAMDQLRAAGDRLVIDVDAPRGPGALTPGDACPDNNVRTATGLALIDFEFAEFRHVAWDAAYLTVPWPTCWCSWRLDPEVRRRALERWRAIVVPALSPEVAAGLDTAIEDATLAWAMMTVAWFLPPAFAGATAPDSRRRPEPAAIVMSRLALAAGIAPAGSPLHATAVEALAAARTTWGEHEIALAPAWLPV